MSNRHNKGLYIRTNISTLIRSLQGFTSAPLPFPDSPIQKKGDALTGLSGRFLTGCRPQL